MRLNPLAQSQPEAWRVRMSDALTLLADATDAHTDEIDQRLQHGEPLSYILWTLADNKAFRRQVLAVDAANQVCRESGVTEIHQLTPDISAAVDTAFSDWQVDTPQGSIAFRRHIATMWRNLSLTLLLEDNCEQA